MGQTKILLDTNTYLRLAQSIHPLLGIQFGKEKLTLYIHKEIEIELKRSPRLQGKFSWIGQEEYVDNRKRRLNISKEKQKDIENTCEHIKEFQKDLELSLSRVDIYCVATALELNIQLVTDDQDMVKVCKDFDVQVISTLQLMKLMIDNDFIDKQLIDQIIDYWKYEKDLPANFHKDYKALFKEEPP